MIDKIKRLNTTLLISIIILLPVNQIVLNYVFKSKVFSPIADSTDYLIQPTLILNIISLLLFSFIIFVIGKHNLSSVFFSKEKLKIAFLTTFFIWFTFQMITIIWVFLSSGNIQLVDNIGFRTGSLLSQLLGNAAFEELIYRGILFLQFFVILKSKTTHQKSLFYAVIFSQIIFALIHIPNRLLINQVDNLITDLFGLFVAGTVLTLIFIHTENLIFVIGSHALINQSYNLINTSIPVEISIYILIILISIFWKKISIILKPNNYSR